MKPPQLGLIAASLAGGPGRILTELAVRWPTDESGTARAITVSLLALTEPQLQERLGASAIPLAIVDKQGKFDPGAWGRFRHIIDAAACDSLISFDFASNLFAWQRVLGTDMTWIACVHGLEAAFVPWRRWLQKLAFRRAAAVVVPSQAVKDKLVKYRMVAANRISVIHNGIDLQPVSERHLDAEHRRLACIANFYSPVKGHAVLAKAMALLPAHYRLVFVGTGALLDEVRAWVRAADLEDRVSFVGARTHAEIRDLLQGIDAVVIPSLSESFGIAAIEAMERGVPVVASRVGGLPEVVDSDSGTLVPANDPKVLANGILAVCEDRARILALGRAARLRVAQRFDIEHVAHGYFALLEARHNATQTPHAILPSASAGWIFVAWVIAIMGLYFYQFRDLIGRMVGG